MWKIGTFGWSSRGWHVSGIDRSIWCRWCAAHMSPILKPINKVKKAMICKCYQPRISLEEHPRNDSQSYTLNGEPQPIRVRCMVRCKGYDWLWLKVAQIFQPGSSSRCIPGASRSRCIPGGNNIKNSPLSIPVWYWQCHRHQIRSIKPAWWNQWIRSPVSYNLPGTTARGYWSRYAPSCDMPENSVFITAVSSTID